MTITEFLLAEIAKDEAVARRGYERPPLGALDSVNVSSGDEGDPGRDYLAIDPARVLAECAAKQRIVEIHHMSGPGAGACETCTSMDYVGLVDEGPCATLHALASVYADRPDFDESWRA